MANHRKPRGLRWPARLLTRILRRFPRTIAFLRIFRAQVINRKSVPQKGAVIIIANHPSQRDPFVLWGALRRAAVFMAKQELFSYPGFGLLMSVMGHIPVKRGNRESGALALRLATRVLEHYGVFIIFPDGGCSKKLKPRDAWKSGFARLALETGAHILPVGIKYGRFMSVKLHFDEVLIDPIFYSGEDAAKRLMDDAYARVAVLSDQPDALAA